MWILKLGGEKDVNPATPTEILRFFLHTQYNQRTLVKTTPPSFLRCLRKPTMFQSNPLLFFSQVFYLQSNRQIICVLSVTFHENLGVTPHSNISPTPNKDGLPRGLLPPTLWFPLTLEDSWLNPSIWGSKRLQNSFYEDKVSLRGTSARDFAQTPRRVETKTRLPRKTARAAGLSMLPKDWNHGKTDDYT